MAWSICRNEKSGIDEETGGENQTVIPEKRELTVDLKNMVEAGIIDPVLVTKTALKNAVSVALTIMSADCVISNVRINEGS